MKKTILCFIIPILFFGCKKSHQNPAKGKQTYEAHFTLSTNTSSTLKTNSLRVDRVSTTGPVSGVANKLFYYVYDSSGQLITQLLQDSTTTNFGQITDTFSPGTYSVVVVAYKVTAQNTFSALSAQPKYSTAIFNAQGFDTFYTTFSLTVTNSAVNQNIILARAVGQLQVKITDPIPVGAKSIEIDAITDNNISFSTGLPSGIGNTLKVVVPIPSSAIGTSNFTVTTYVGNTTSPFKVNISANNATGVLATSTATGVTCLKNTRTLLSGNLFEGSTDTFTVTFNTSWDSNPVTINF